MDDAESPAVADEQVEPGGVAEQFVEAGQSAADLRRGDVRLVEVAARVEGGEEAEDDHSRSPE
ncbi:hypothetical protein [Nannocystis pusilla]|uniref:hypothetical protein n=1 Tax=Nannocystis pusilla TaxID=889268 RepID=UPI003B7D1DC1